MKFTFFLLRLLMALMPLAFNAQTIAQFNFNSVPPDISVSTGSLSPVVGSGTLNFIGGVNQTFSDGDGSADPTSNDDSAINLNAFPLQGINNKGAGINIVVNTSGYQNIKVSWSQRHTNASSKYATLQYSIDGTNFVDFDTYQALSPTTWHSRNYDLSSIVALNNNSNAKFRIVSSFAPSTNNYEPSLGGDTYSHLGAWRIDYLTISADAVLTVNLLSFHIEKKQEEVLLKWQTASEQNNDRFEIEYSIDGIKFSKIGEVKGQFNSTTIHDYEYTHTPPSVGKGFYRLKQIDIDGHYTLSKMEETIFFPKKWVVYPNPTKDILFLQNSDNRANQSFVISDCFGHIVLIGKEEVSKPISVQLLPNGLYFIAKGLQRASFVKQ